MIDIDIVKFMVTIFFCGIILLVNILYIAISSIKMKITQTHISMIENDLRCKFERRKVTAKLIKEMDMATTDEERDAVRLRMKWYREIYFLNRKQL